MVAQVERAQSHVLWNVVSSPETKNPKEQTLPTNAPLDLLSDPDLRFIVRRFTIGASKSHMFQALFVL